MIRFSLIALLACTLLYACKHEGGSGHSEQASVPDDQIAARVNDAIISKGQVAQFKSMRGNPQVSDQQVIEEMIATELLRQEAINAGIADNPEVAFQLKMQESELLARSLMREKFANISFTDEELLEAYNQQMANTDTHEYKARHILLKSEDEAQAVIEALRNGADFVTLAQERSTGPSGPNGGDLGWFKASRMVPPFADAVKSMNKGDVSVAPVQTDFGYHVIKLEDMREIEQPDFESIREQVQQNLIKQAINDYINGIRDNAVIVISEN
jgi:peptidyl-prolyl cis-trans isomerase C